MQDESGGGWSGWDVRGRGAGRGGDRGVRKGSTIDATGATSLTAAPRARSIMTSVVQAAGARGTGCGCARTPATYLRLRFT